jgi:hypothetical protein
MNIEAPATFLNLDLELRSHEDLAPLATHFENCAIVLFNGVSNDIFQLTVESSIGGLNESPKACTDELLQTISAFHGALMELFKGCNKRIFDYGFDGGIQAPPFMVDLSAAQLSNMVQFGIDMRITIYPYHAESLADEIESSWRGWPGFIKSNIGDYVDTDIGQTMKLFIERALLTKLNKSLTSKSQAMNHR